MNSQKAKMLQIVPLTFLWVTVTCFSDEAYQLAHNATRSTVSGVAAYRSALTLDWLAGEDSRQRELVHAFETEAAPKPRPRNMQCIGYSRPASGKVARLMLELLKNLEGDEGVIILELIEALLRNKLMVEASALEAEPDLEALVHAPGVMLGEPHSTFPRILAMLWTIASDPITIKKSGWCTIKKLNQYLMLARPVDIAKQTRALDPIVARVRFIMEEFIQNVTPLNMYPDAMLPTPAPKKKTSKKKNLQLVSRGARDKSTSVTPWGGTQDYGPEVAPPAEPLQDPLQDPLWSLEEPSPPDPKTPQTKLAPMSRAVRPTSAFAMLTMSVVLV